MRKPFVMGLLGLAWAAGCGNANPSSKSVNEPLASGSSAIQGGMDDTTHNFAVGIVEMSDPQTIAFCSGVLLAPNLVATARHCVSKLESPQIDCATSAFIDTLPASDIFVTADPTITQNGTFSAVASIHVPASTSVCGNDIALLILSKSIDLPAYVTPTISPPMTDHQLYSTAVCAIGYGVDTPSDTTGASAGTRRIKEDLNLVCIPGDATFSNCLSDPAWIQFATENEFEGGDGTCDGDSGSGAYDQASFDKGEWVAYGVLSRGGVSPEGGTCTGSIYTRFDAWGTLIVDTANMAASMGGYAPPSWTVLSADQTTGTTGANSESSPSACLANATACLQDSECCSVNCISHDNNVTSFCTACDPDNPCNTGFGCQGGLCVAGASTIEADSGTPAEGPPATHAGGGCAVGGAEAGTSLPWSGGTVGLAFAAVALGRRRPRRS